MPSLLVVVSIEAPDGVVNNTVAPTSVAPDGSVTWPRITPVWFCAWHGNATRMANSNNRTPLPQNLSVTFFCISRKFRPSAISIPPPALLPRRVSSAVAQTPRRQNARCLFLCRGLQKRFHPAQHGDGRHWRVLQPTCGDNHHRLAFLKIRQRCCR